MKCPRCGGPSRTDRVQDRARCALPSCQFDFCLLCLMSFHYAQRCKTTISPPSVSTPDSYIGGRKSRRQLRRLCWLATPRQLFPWQHVTMTTAVLATACPMVLIWTILTYMNEWMFICHRPTHRINIVSNINSPDRIAWLRYSAKYCPTIKEK